MAQKSIGSNWTRETRIALESNFTELYNEFLGAGNNASDAKRLAMEAVVTANAAKTETESIKAQLDLIIVKGDSSVEAAAARLPVEGVAYATLKDRLDAENTEVTQQMELKSTKTKRVNINDFPRLPPEDSDDFRIKRALDSLPNKRGHVLLDGVAYVTKLPVLLSWYQGLIGVYGSTEIQKTGNATSADHLFDTIVGIKAEGQVYIYGVSLIGVTLKGMSQNEFGLRLGYSSHLNISDVTISDVQKGIRGDDVWLAEYTRVVIRNYAFQGYEGVRIDNGTSNVFTRCWVKNHERGYDLRGLFYSLMNACACDTFTVHAYTGGDAVTFNSCGAEDGKLVDGGFVFGSRARVATFNSPHAYNIKSAQPAGRTSIFLFNGSRATVNNLRLDLVAGDNLVDLARLDSDAEVNFNNYQIQRTKLNRLFNVTDNNGKATVLGGSSFSFYFKDENLNQTIDYKQPWGFDREKISRKGVGFSASVDLEKRTASTQASVPLLEILPSTIPGSGTVSMHFEVIINKISGSTALLRGYGTIIDGVKKAITLENVHGSPYNATISWAGDKLIFSLGESFSNAVIETKVFQRASNGTVYMAWL